MVREVLDRMPDAVTRQIEVYKINYKMIRYVLTDRLKDVKVYDEIKGRRC